MTQFLMKPPSHHRAVQLLHDDVLQHLAVIQWCASSLVECRSLNTECVHAVRLMEEAASTALASARKAIEELASDSAPGY